MGQGAVLGKRHWARCPSSGLLYVGHSSNPRIPRSGLLSLSRLSQYRPEVRQLLWTVLPMPHLSL